MRLYRRSRGRY